MVIRDLDEACNWSCRVGSAPEKTAPLI